MQLDLLNSPIEPGLTVIEASAGTGKTYSISHLVPRLLLQGTLPELSKLLLVTFTKDAARELAEGTRRVLARLAAPPEPDESENFKYIAGLRPLLADPAARLRLDRALLDLDLLAVSTIHAFCQRTLQQEGSLCGLPVMPEVIADDTEHLEPIVRKQWIDALSADATLAALATAQGWELGSALSFINTRRRCLRPKSEPAVAPYAQLRAQLDTLCTALASPILVSSSSALLGTVAGWNKGVTCTADALIQLKPIHAGTADTLAYWQAVAFAESLPGKVTARTTSARALKAGIAADPWFVAVRELRALTSRLQWAWHHALADQALPALEETMERHRLITQDGLIGALYRALHRPGPAGTAQSARLANRLALRYHVALIDESQDTDPRQFAIFKRIFLEAGCRRHLILVGDPKQAIYGFRGADLSTYLAARAMADACYTLSHTHRAPKALVDTVNRLFDRPRSFHHPDMVFEPAQSALKYDRQLLRNGLPCSRLETWIVPDDDNPAYSAKGRRIPALSARVASTIVDLLHHGEILTTFNQDFAVAALPPRSGERQQADSTIAALAPGSGERQQADSAATAEFKFNDGRVRKKAVTPSNFAVLVATNEQAQAMAGALQALGVPAVVNSGADVFSSDEARELHTVLQALLESHRTHSLRSALATRMLGLDAVAIEALDTPPPSGGEAPGVAWLERFTQWRQIWTTRGLAALLAEWEQPEIALTRRLALVPLTGERRATNYRHITDLLLAAARDEAPRPVDLVAWLGQQIARAQERSDAEERQLQLSTDREAVQVVTMHKAKGLEYPLVFCPYLADPLRKTEGLAQFPAKPTNAATIGGDLLVNFDLLDDAARETLTRVRMAAQMEERLRLAYVALTRAQVRAWICSYRPSPAYDLGSPLDWLLRPEKEIAEYPAYSVDWANSVKSGGSERVIAALSALGAKAHADDAPSDRAPVSITFRPPPEPAPVRYEPGSTTPDTLSAPPSLGALAEPSVPPSWRITSFSTLTREKHAHGAPAAAPSDSQEASAREPADSGAQAAPIFLGAPAGAAVGTAVHDWIETWDFGPPSGEALARHVAAARLPATSDDQPAWEQTLLDLFGSLRLIRLPGFGEAPLHTLCPDAHGSEWHFQLPLAGELTASALARCFASHAAPAHHSYALTLATLSNEGFVGQLQGFIDRLVHHGPAWGVIDWKTNYLGPALSDYSDEELLRCAMKEHYLLQAHLYLVALRRYLRALGLAGAPIAGAWLVFLRAIAPGGTRGVLHIDPPPEMLDALDALFAYASRATP